MNIIKIYTYKSICLLTSGAIALLFMLGACNKDFPNRLKADSKNDTLGVNAKTRKVLYIIVDGVRGRALKGVNAPNFNKIVKNSIYAYDALTDIEGVGQTNAGGWANMLTGVKRAKHGVTTEDFLGNHLASYPSLLSRIKESSRSLRTASFSASAIFNDQFSKDAVEKKTFEGDDLAVKDEVKKELEKEEASVIIAQFHAAETVGKNSGYEENSPAYAAAVLQLDTYIGEIMNSLAKRKNVTGENWLVVIASNKGGVIPANPNNVDFTAYADPLRNNFIVFYNPRFGTLFVPKPDSEKLPYSGLSVQFDYRTNARTSATIINTDLYNFGSNGNFTIQILVRTQGDQNYPVFLSKRSTGFSGVGWNMFLEGNYWMINSSVANQVKGRTINDGKWHKLTVVFDGKNSKLRTYTDGQFDNEQTMNSNNLNNASPLKLGYLRGNENTSASILMNGLQIFNVALTAQDISAYSCKTTIDSSHPKYHNLIGYWPMQEGMGNKLVEKTGTGNDFVMGGSPSWQTFNDYSPALCPQPDVSLFKMVPNSIDIPFMIYQWLGIPVPDFWGLDGKTWTPVYSDIKS
jgi:hypothetical protein